MGGEAADAKSAVFDLNTIQTTDGAKAHQTTRAHKSLLHHDDQRGATGDELCVGAEFLQRCMNFFEILGCAVFKRYHGAILIWRIDGPFGSIR